MVIEIEKSLPLNEVYLLPGTSAHQPQYINLSPGPSSESLKEETTAETAIQTQPIKPVVKLRRLGTVCYDYNAREQDELSLKHGSVVEIIKEECGEKGWILAQVDKKKGMIPKNYVALVGSQPSVINSEEVQRTNRSLGSGGFAEVFRGFFGGKEVALKVPNTCSTQNRETLTREALILSRISHKNIVEFYGLSLNPLFIILELCEGGTLFTLTCRKMSSSDVSTVISWARQVGEAIQYLHSRDDPVVYADLKAENVLVKEIPCECGLEDESWKIVTNYQRNGQCKKCHGLRIDLITLKLADFNVSRYHSVKRDSLAGSWPWMSPEVIKDKNVSESSDVWSFGSFLWEIFSRKIPFNNCEKQTIIYAILFKKEELLPLPLPKDLPGELQIIFEQCWRKNPIERPNIQEVLKLLELAEQSVDSNYKWIVKEEQAPKQEIDLDLEKDVIKNISQEYSEGKSVTISLEALMFMERLGVYQKFQGMIKKHGFSLNPTTPAKRQKKPKVDKESIGTPSDFRHNVSARLCSASPPHGESSSSGYSREKILEIRYLEDNEKPQHHRSHDSLIEQNKEEGQGPYCTLPKAFRQKVATLQNQEGHFSPIIFPKSDRIRHNSQAEHLNPKGRNRVCRLRHDYLTLGPCSCATGCRRTIIPNALKQRAGMASLVGARKEERSDNHTEANNKTSIDGSPTEDSKKEPEYLSTDEDTNRTLNRANAIRPKFGEQREQPQPAESTQSSDSSSSSVDGFVVVGDCGGDGGGDLHNSRDQPTRKHMNLPNLFNRRISPPQQIVQTPSSSSSSQNDFHQQKSGKEKRNRKASNEHKVANSTFHIPLKGDEELDVDEKTDPDSTPDSSRPRSAKLGWVNRIFGTSPRHSTADDTSEAVVQMARCHHPNHSYAETTHLCPLISGMNLLVPEINLSPVPELPIANHVIEQQPVPAIYPKGYKKRADYPEKLRQKQLLQRFEAMANAPPKKRTIIPAAELSGTKERLSMNTVIEIHHPNKNNAHHNYGPSDAPFSLPINSARSYTDLNGAHSTFCSSDQQKAKQNNALLSPDRILLDPLHQRSRSSDNPTFVHSPTTSDLVQKLLLPVPSNGPIPNPSYVPMRDSQKIDKRKLPPPPIPSKSNVVVKATVNVPPVPLPRTSIPRQQNTNGAANTPWPTSQAPVLSRDQRDSKLIARPDSLHLTPRIPHFPPNNASTPLTTPTTSNSLFTNSSASGGPLPSNLMPHCDSGIDPEAGTEADASPYPIEPRICEHGTTVFPSVPNISPRNQLPSAAIRRRSGAAFPGQLQPHAINPGIPPQLPTTPPPPLPPKRVVDGPRVPPIPNNIKKFNNRF